MSILDSLVFGIRKLWVNGVEQPDKGEIEFSGAGVTVSQVGAKNVVSISGSGGGGGNTTAEYLLAAADGTLPNSRVLTASSSISVTNATGTSTLACIMGTTAGTCCVGNDVRVPASNPSSATTGHSVVSNGSRVVYRGDVGRWWNCGSTPTSTAIATDTIQFPSLPNLPMVGQPIRILDSTGMIYNNTDITDTPTIVAADAITGLKGSLLDHRGRLWFKLVVTSSPTCRYDIYSVETCATANLVGHTSTFTGGVIGNQTLTITADNASGLGGTVTVDPRGGVTVAAHSVQYFRTGMITAYDPDEGQLVFCGQLVTTNSGAIKEVWYGAPELVVAIHGQIVGPYAPETTNTALLSRNADALLWPAGPSTIVCVRAKHLVADTGATQPKFIPVIDGVPLVSDANSLSMATSWDTMTCNSTPNILRIGRLSAIEFRTVAGTKGDARNAIFDVIGVLD